MKSNELFEQIHEGIIKDNSTIQVMTEEGQVITKINYKNKGLKWEQGKFDTKYLCDIDIEFEVEEPEEIDIQGIEEIGKMLGWAKISLENNVEEQKESINFSLDFFGSKINEIIENQNILLGAVKQLDRKIGGNK